MRRVACTSLGPPGASASAGDVHSQSVIPPGCGCTVCTTTESAAIWLSGWAVPPPGTMHRNPQVGATYRRLLAEAEAAGGGREAEVEAAGRPWYEGFVAEAIDGYLRRVRGARRSGVRHPGLLRA